jgi:hypothetical protein
MVASRFGTMVNGNMRLILTVLLAVEPALAQEGDPVKGKSLARKSKSQWIRNKCRRLDARE